jgi:riboflavin synthase
LTCAAGRDLTDGMVPKGSVALHGVSLTLVEVAADHFSVALIPTTLAETNLGELAVGDAVNVELDLIGKYVRKAVAGAAGEGLTVEKLRRAGFA